MQALLAGAARRLADAGIRDSRREARTLVAYALGLREDPVALYDQAPTLDQRALDRLASIVERRAAGEPISRIVGRRGFWTLEFALSPATLDPRPATETLVEAALARVPADRPVRIIDLGTGTGCLLAAILVERPLAIGIAVDVNAAAAGVARANLEAAGLAARATVVVGDWGSALSCPADLVVCNPPYIETSDLATLETSVRDHDPMMALDGGGDGLLAYRALSGELPRLLRAGGWAIIEVGFGQMFRVCHLLSRGGIRPLAVRTDLQGIERCLVAQKMVGIL